MGKKGEKRRKIFHEKNIMPWLSVCFFHKNETTLAIWNSAHWAGRRTTRCASRLLKIDDELALQQQKWMVAGKMGRPRVQRLSQSAQLSQESNGRRARHHPTKCAARKLRKLKPGMVFRSRVMTLSLERYFLCWFVKMVSAGSSGGWRCTVVVPAPSSLHSQITTQSVIILQGHNCINYHLVWRSAFFPYRIGGGVMNGGKIFQHQPPAAFWLTTDSWLLLNSDSALPIVYTYIQGDPIW